MIVLTTFDLDECVYASLAAGATGFLLKDTTAGRILAAVRTIAAGGRAARAADHPTGGRPVGARRGDREDG
ncbi:response regulator transcription factor [Kibdelosporangium phytohabitans]|uniref:Response regulatory domain-containing protein n=1 Tax=Kibdelosporangium phytohabitans TaxID=860235 RepID=A0A0N9I454_9PSEU|nr:hypothetical protein AOZ06_24170 [Kibdelosporangium phytohabitans]MBE1469085.1 DNA-binding NarL/FixJ family response regulator [Kibdelosporangium phytohabitans]